MKAVGWLEGTTDRQRRRMGFGYGNQANEDLLECFPSAPRSIVGEGGRRKRMTLGGSELEGASLEEVGV